MLERGRGDDLCYALKKQLPFDVDDEANDAFHRIVDVVAGDDDGANHRSEAGIDQSYAKLGTKRGRVQSRCTVHNKSAMAKPTINTTEPKIDSTTIRLKLALSRTPRSKALFKHEIRIMISEQLVILTPGKHLLHLTQMTTLTARRFIKSI